MSEAQPEKPEATIISSSVTLSSVEFTNQFLNEHADVNLSEILKDPAESEVQSMVDVPVKQVTLVALRHLLVDSTVTLIPDTTTYPSPQPPPTKPKRIKIKHMMKKSHNPDSQVDDTSLENKVYRLERMIKLPKGVPNFKKIKLEKVAKQKVPKSSWNKIATAIYDQKSRLYRMMEEVKAFNSHLAYKALYDALAVSLSIDEDDMDRIFGKSCQTKRKRDDHDKDPSPNADKDSKKRQKKPNPYKYDKDQAGSSNQVCDSSLADPVINKTKWFKQSPRLATPEYSDLDWSKDQNADTGPEQNWFLELEKTAKASKDFDDGSCRSCIELEYHLEQRYLAFSDKLDWINPKGDRIPQDVSKPIPLLNAHGKQYIPAEFFFNQDLEYIRSGNLEERKYTTSLTKRKATRYELYRIEEMIQILNGYCYLKEIVVKRENQKEYMFKEADFPSLQLNDIEDMFLLYYQNKFHYLDGKIQTDFAVALRFFIQRTNQAQSLRCPIMGEKLPNQAQPNQASSFSSRC
ncbi:hypothetical protein Tco_0351286 [Tanacetum coccineum]